jgi:hypothetical protein
LPRRAAFFIPVSPFSFKEKSMSQELIDQGQFQSLAASATRSLRKDATTQGISTQTGMLFYDLRPPAYLLYPVNTPLRNSIPRVGKQNAGTGTAAHWKAFVNPNATNVFAGVAEGQRNSFLSFSEKDYTAAYKEIGHETFTTFTGQFAAEGFSDPMADSQTMILHSIMLSEEGMLLHGNASVALGTAPTPTATLKSGAGLADSTKVSVAVVALTGQGWYLQNGTAAVVNGLTPVINRQNADGTTTSVNGGMSAISAMSAVVTTGSGSNQVTAKCSAVKGAVAYAWFVNVTDATSPSLANAKLAAITTAPVFTVTAAAAGTQSGNAVGLNTDTSQNALSFDGFFSYAAQSGINLDLGGAALTPNGDGTVVEIESVLASLWNQYQATVDTIYVSNEQLTKITAAILAGTNGNPSAFRINLDQQTQGKIVGGSMTVSYLSKYTMQGAKAIDIKLHPGLTPGTMLFDITTNPYPHSRVGNVREILTQRDYYSLLYPIRTRRWEYGTYVHEVLAHKLPQLTAVITGADAS